MFDIIEELFMNGGCLMSEEWQRVSYLYGTFAETLYRKQQYGYSFVLYLACIVIIEILIFDFLAEFFDKKKGV